MSKRPTGFGKASREKKLKLESKNEPAQEDAELNIELANDVDDEELAEIYGLYAKLQTERDPKLARGLIHECDQLLRARDAIDEKLPDKFHVVYGGALLTLADPSHEKKEHKQFRDAGVERINVGLTSLNDEAVALAGLELTQFVHTQIQPDRTLTSAGEKILKHAVSLLKKRRSQHHVELAKAALLLLQLLDELLPNQHEDAVGVAKSVLQSQIDAANAETKRWGHKGLGQYYLSQVAPEVRELEANETNSDLGEDQKAAVLTKLVKAISHFRQTLSETDQESYVLLAETLLTSTEFQPASVSEADLDSIYAEAIKHLKKARLLGNEGLTEVIESLESRD